MTQRYQDNVATRTFAFNGTLLQHWFDGLWFWDQDEIVFKFGT